MNLTIEELNFLKTWLERMPFGQVINTPAKALYEKITNELSPENK